MIAAVLATMALAGGGCQDLTYPCWTWSTMGHHKRAVVLAGGRRLRIVGPVAYCRLRRAGKLSVRNQYLKGDHIAMGRCDADGGQLHVGEPLGPVTFDST